MKIWEAIQMLEQMDQTKECTINFAEAKAKAPYFDFQKHQYVDPNTRDRWVDQYVPNRNVVTCIDNDVGYNSPNHSR